MTNPPQQEAGAVETLDQKAHHAGFSLPGMLRWATRQYESHTSECDCNNCSSAHTILWLHRELTTARAELERERRRAYEAEKEISAAMEFCKKACTTDDWKLPLHRLCQSMQETIWQYDVEEGELTARAESAEKRASEAEEALTGMKDGYEDDEAAMLELHQQIATLTKRLAEIEGAEMPEEPPELGVYLRSLPEEIRAGIYKKENEYAALMIEAAVKFIEALRTYALRVTAERDAALKALGEMREDAQAVCGDYMVECSHFEWDADLQEIPVDAISGAELMTRVRRIFNLPVKP